MIDYLTYLQADSSNAQFLCHFAFPFLKFWIIPYLLVIGLSVQGFQQEMNFTSLQFFNVVFETDISINCIIPVARGFEQKST